MGEWMDEEALLQLQTQPAKTIASEAEEEEQRTPKPQRNTTNCGLQDRKCPWKQRSNFLAITTWVLPWPQGAEGQTLLSNQST
eukprot:2877675-Rhodomonas_salina.1